MRIEHLQYLLEIAKCHSISTAAKKLYISQTGLSAIVNSIEAELNIQIFRRSNKGTLLTPEGEQAIKLMEEIINKNDELHFLYSDDTTQNQIINLGIFPAGTYALSRYLVPLWADIHKNAHLHIYEIGYEDTKNCISNNTSRIVVSADTPLLYKNFCDSKNDKTYIESLYEDHFCFLTSPESPLAKASDLHIEDLLEYHLLLTHHYPGPQDKTIGYIIHKFNSFTVLNNLEVAKRILLENPNTLMITPSISIYDDPLLCSHITRLDIHDFDPKLVLFMMCDISKKLSIQETMLMQVSAISSNR